MFNHPVNQAFLVLSIVSLCSVFRLIREPLGVRYKAALSSPGADEDSPGNTVLELMSGATLRCLMGRNVMAALEVVRA